MKKIGKILFKYRSYTPLPFVFAMILFMQPTLLSMVLGFIVAALGEAVRVWSVGYAGSETRTTSGVGGSNLVTQGPYAIIRNPLYWGNIMIYAGVGIMSNALFPWLVIIAFLYFVFQYYAIILNEEEYLRNTYKDEFETYCSHVKRFLPLPKELPESAKSKLQFELSEGFRSERRSLQAVTIVTLIIVLGYLVNTYGWFRN